MVFEIGSLVLVLMLEAANEDRTECLGGGAIEEVWERETERWRGCVRRDVRGCRHHHFRGMKIVGRSRGVDRDVDRGGL